jgi:urease accessory protein
MLRLTKNHGQIPIAADADTLILNFQDRTRGRLRVVTKSGQDAGIFLERGKVLQEGDVLQSECGQQVRVVCETEEVAEAKAADWQTFARCCYHLGNRHVPLQVGDKWLRIKPDHVLEEMVELLGLTVKRTSAAFCPEQGAYAGGHSHGHHSHDHDHDHDHDHSHSHGVHK